MLVICCCSSACVHCPNRTASFSQPQTYSPSVYITAPPTLDIDELVRKLKDALKPQP